MSKQDLQWQAESDAQTMARYQEIISDKARMNRAVKEANKQEQKDTFTDDASVVEGIGQKVTMVEGNRENIKITTPFDITIAEALLK